MAAVYQEQCPPNRTFRAVGRPQATNSFRAIIDGMCLKRTLRRVQTLKMFNRETGKRD
jgi:hypothetical protein